MSIQALQSHPPFMTRLAFAYEYRIPYSIVSDRIRRGEIELHLIDRKVQINVEEALKACQPKHPKKVETKSDLFS
jgi:hypothetical protein